VKADAQFAEKGKQYAKAGASHSVEEKGEDYLRLNCREDEIYLKLQTRVGQLGVNFIHRQSHMPMFHLDIE
jgi:hypothetical protein